MKLLKNIGKLTKQMARGLSKGVRMADKYLSQADRYTGGALRLGANALSGGLSEMALRNYNQNKHTAHKLLNSDLNRRDIYKAGKEAYQNNPNARRLLEQAILK